MSAKSIFCDLISVSLSIVKETLDKCKPTAANLNYLLFCRVNGQKGMLFREDPIQVLSFLEGLPDNAGGSFPARRNYCLIGSI
jgi:hypothetical protein